MQGEPSRFRFSAGTVLAAADPPSGRDDCVPYPRGYRFHPAGSTHRPVTGSLRLTTCAQAGVRDAYTGGFFLMTRAACVPLLFRIGSRTATVSFSIGHRCG